MFENALSFTRFKNLDSSVSIVNDLGAVRLPTGSVMEFVYY